jgi:hypothetical protein
MAKYKVVTLTQDEAKKAARAGALFRGASLNETSGSLRKSYFLVQIPGTVSGRPVVVTNMKFEQALKLAKG